MLICSISYHVAPKMWFLLNSADCAYINSQYQSFSFFLFQTSKFLGSFLSLRVASYMLHFVQ